MDELLSETVSLAESEIASVEPPEPKSIGSGIVKSVLGKGGASVVYEIWNPKLEIFRAVKLWRIVQSEKTIQRFENETKITAKLNHPNIVEIYTVGEWNGLPYIEMEKIQGSNLKDLIKSNGAFPEIVVTAIAMSICRALIYAHNHKYTLAGKICKGVVHCDIKPANIMISESGIIKLMDFGIAHPSNNTKSDEKSSVTGSLQYMSPEQLESRPVDHRSDLYSIGVLLYELYSGTKAFPARSLKELIKKRNNNEFSSLSSFCKNLSSKAKDIVEKLMKINPDERFQSAEELNDQFQKIYQKTTDVLPETLISTFLAGELLDIRKKKGRLSKQIFSFTVISGLILALAFFFLNSKQTIVNKVKKNHISSDSSDSVEVISHKTTDKGSEKPINPAPKPRGVSENVPVAPKRKIQSKKFKKSVASVEIAKPIIENSDQFTLESILDEIRRLVEEGGLVKAERMFREFPLNDGEYHLLYGELLLKKSQLKKAMAEAEKALRIPASRISPVELRGKILYLKACILAAEFDQAPQKQNGQIAMEAWYEVKYTYRSNTSHPHFSKADTEIRRISALLQ